MNDFLPFFAICATICVVSIVWIFSKRDSRVVRIERAVVDGNSKLELLNSSYEEKQHAWKIVAEQWSEKIHEEEQKAAACELRRKEIEKDIVQKLDSQKRDAAAAKKELQDARRELEALEHDVRYELSEAGFYAPMYDFESSNEYELRLVDIRSHQKNLIANKSACFCDKEWVIGGNRSEGKKVVSSIMKLMLRAFNGESDAIIAKVKFSNMSVYEKQLYKSFEAINKLGSGFSCRLSSDYVSLKIQEMRLVYEYNEKLYEEKEEQRALKDKMREEKRAQEELERAEREAKDEEERYQLALDRAKVELKTAHESQKNKLLADISELERKLKEAEEKKLRAISMAQQTKAGHVYIISNIGSFGEDVFKIGMTRRLEPQDRVDELGGASVPFRFDVHAMVKTEDAPALEVALHRAFHHQRMNKENKHKEFFKVSLVDIETAVKELHGDFTLTKLAEAREYRKGLATNVVSIPLPKEKHSELVKVTEKYR